MRKDIDIRTSYDEKDAKAWIIIFFIGISFLLGMLFEIHVVKMSVSNRDTYMDKTFDAYWDGKLYRIRDKKLDSLEGEKDV